jgi:hypothetical protein
MQSRWIGVGGWGGVLNAIHPVMCVRVCVCARARLCACMDYA